jgi:hypothetical protein
LNRKVRKDAGSAGARGQLVIAIAVVLLAVLFPGTARAHGRSTVVALDYEARVATADVAPGVHTRVVDGDRRLQLSVAPPRTVVVAGYGGEPFLRFSAHGVEANLESPTAVADGLVPAATVATPTATTPPRWAIVSTHHSLTWHDHRLGLRSGEGAGAGRIGHWSIPIVVDGKTTAIRGSLWRSTRPSILPWLVLGLVALVGAGAVVRLGSPRFRRASVFVATGVSALLLVVLSIGFASATGRTGLVRWADLGLPLGIALAAAAVLVLRPRQRYVACALVAGFIFAVALEDVSVLWHGFVVSSLPAQAVRAGVATALAAGAYVVLVVLADLLREEPPRRGRAGSRPPARLAIPKGRPR